MSVRNRQNKKCPVLLRCKSKREGSLRELFLPSLMLAIREPPKLILRFEEPPAQTTAFVRNALPKVALLSLANQTSQMLLLVFLDDCHSLLLVSSATGSTRKRPPIPSEAWSVSIPSTGIINKK